MIKCLLPQKVPMMPEEFQKTSHFVQEVSEMTVHLDASGKTILMCVGDYIQGQDRVVYALSPPAANQLSKLLRNKVKEHLKYKPPAN